MLLGIIVISYKTAVGICVGVLAFVIVINAIFVIYYKLTGTGDKYKYEDRIAYGIVLPVFVLVLLMTGVLIAIYS